jgi:hypothetical protein
VRRAKEAKKIRRGPANAALAQGEEPRAPSLQQGHGCVGHSVPNISRWIGEITSLMRTLNSMSESVTLVSA